MPWLCRVQEFRICIQSLLKGPENRHDSVHGFCDINFPYGLAKSSLYGYISINPKHMTTVSNVEDGRRGGLDALSQAPGVQRAV